MPSGGFTMLLDDVLLHPEIQSLFQATLVCFVDRYPGGFWLRTRNAANFLKVDRRTFERNRAYLIKKEWLFWDKKANLRRPVLRAIIKPLPPGELYEQLVKKTASKMRSYH
jgi:hypothetical protein